MTTHEVLVAARNLIDREGWGKGNRSMSVCGPVCAEGAIARALGLSLEPEALEATYTTLAEHPAYLALQAQVAMNRVFTWNDCVAETQAEVLAAFDRAIVATAPVPADPFGVRESKAVFA